MQFLLVDKLECKVICYPTGILELAIELVITGFVTIPIKIYLLEMNWIGLFIYEKIDNTKLIHWIGIIYSLTTHTPHTHPSDSYHTQTLHRKLHLQGVAFTELPWTNY